MKKLRETINQEIHTIKLAADASIKAIEASAKSTGCTKVVAEKGINQKLIRAEKAVEIESIVTEIIRDSVSKMESEINEYLAKRGR